MGITQVPRNAHATDRSWKPHGACYIYPQYLQQWNSSMHVGINYLLLNAVPPKYYHEHLYNGEWTLSSRMSRSGRRASQQLTAEERASTKFIRTAMRITTKWSACRTTTAFLPGHLTTGLITTKAAPSCLE